jgi:methionine-rich copper-binding protein CopC
MQRTSKTDPEFVLRRSNLSLLLLLLALMAARLDAVMAFSRPLDGRYEKGRLNVVAPTAALSPANDATGAPVGSSLVLTFQEPVTKGSGDISITHGATSQSIALSAVVLADDGLKATIDPADFPYATLVEVTVPATAFAGLDGAAYAGTTPATWHFTTDAAPSDAVAPVVDALSPADNAVGVSVSGDLVLTFSERVVKGSGPLAITITHGSTSQEISLDNVSLSNNGQSATIDPAGNFPFAAQVSVLVPGAAFKDEAGNLFAGIAAGGWNFTTEPNPDSQAPTATLSPAEGAGNVSVTSNLVLTFSEPVTKGSGTIAITHGATSQNIDVSNVSLSSSGLTATIDPADFPSATTVTVSIPNTAFKDEAGNPYAGTTASTWSFTTGTAPDTQAPTATLSPQNGATSVSVGSNLVLTFSERVVKGTDPVAITLTYGAIIQEISLSNVSLSNDGLTATIDPPANFPFSTAVGVSVPNTAFKDEAGNPFAGTTAGTWRFTTEPNPDTRAPTATLSPANGATNVSVGSNLVLTFSERVTKGSGTIAITHGSTGQSIGLDQIDLSADGLTATINPADFPFAYRGKCVGARYRFQRPCW